MAKRKIVDSTLLAPEAPKPPAVEPHAKAPAPSRSTDIELDNIGPVDHLKIELKPGVTILLGENGVGKSESLAAIGTVLKGEGRGDVQASDGADRGEIRVGDVTLRVGRSSRRIGELAVQHLEGRFDISDLAAPQRKDPASADAVGIKALVSLSGVKADAAKFAALLPGEFDATVDVESLNTDDPVEMAARVKRAFEKVARKEEEAAEKIRAQAEAVERLLADVPADSEASEAELMARLEAAIARNSELESQQNAADMAAGRQQRAKEQLAKIEAQEKAAGLVSPAEAGKALESAALARGKALEAVTAARAALGKAEDDLRAAQAAEASAVERKREAEARVSQRAAAEKALQEAGNAPRPEPEEIEAAAAELEAARKAQSAAAAGREFRSKRAEAVKLRETAKAHEKHAEKLRDAAAATDDVLTEMVQSKVLKIKTVDGQPRLVLPTKRGPATFYRDLSDGERYDVGIDAAVEHLPPGGLLVLRQTAWQDLSPKRRARVDAKAREKGVSILTAQVDNGELRAEPFGGAE